MYRNASLQHLHKSSCKNRTAIECLKSDKQYKSPRIGLSRTEHKNTFLKGIPFRWRNDKLELCITYDWIGRVIHILDAHTLGLCLLLKEAPFAWRDITSAGLIGFIYFGSIIFGGKTVRTRHCLYPRHPARFWCLPLSLSLSRSLLFRALSLSTLKFQVCSAFMYFPIHKY